MKHKNRILGYAIFFSALIIISILLQSSAGASGNESLFTDYSLSQITGQKVIWREDVYDPSMKTNVSVLKIDDIYFSSVSGPEKAVLGYLASTIGNECYADGSKQNVKCKILSALNLGYQCSDETKSFLKSWFRDDAGVVKQIDNCKPTIATTVEKTFDEVKISSADNTIKVELKGLKLNIKENSASKWSESLTFKVDGDKVTMTERTKKK